MFMKNKHLFKKYLLHNYIGAIGPNYLEIENNICDLEVLSPHSCMPCEIILKTQMVRSNNQCFHSFSFYLGMGYLEGLLNVVPAEMDLLLLQS